MKKPLDVLAVIGLVLGGVFGMAGTFVMQPHLRAIFWAIDSVGLIAATVLLALRFFRLGTDCAAAGFLVFAIGEGVMLSGTASSLEASVPAFAAGISLWSAALVMTSISRAFPNWVRAVAVISAVLFGITAVQIFWGAPIDPLSRPLPNFAYPFLVLTFVGWIVKILRTE